MDSKSILKISTLAVSFFIIGALHSSGVSSAEDVWCCARDGRSFYLDTDSINDDKLPKGMTYRAAVKAVRDSDGSLEKIAVYGFESQNDIMVGMMYDKAADLWDIGETPVARAVWETMKPYMRQKQIPYSDSWVWE
ncbi:MAG: hypothetical protein IJ631_02960 [Schwartzia sp.]|nr:hypothetical protein [Schwartzia sp. (in: firmicutes)]